MILWSKKGTLTSAANNRLPRKEFPFSLFTFLRNFNLFILHYIPLGRSARRRYWSGRPMVSADRGGLYVLRDLEQDSVNPVLSPSGLISCKKGYPIGYPFAWKERETGLEPAASTLARSRSTNWATRAYLIVFCCSPQDKWYYTAASPKSQALFLFFYIFYFHWSEKCISPTWIITAYFPFYCIWYTKYGMRGKL